MFIIVEGFPGSGKSTLIRKMMNQSAGTVCCFHVPDILKKEGIWRHLLTSEETKFIDENFSKTWEAFRNGGIAQFEDDPHSLNGIVTRIIDVLDEKFDTVILDAYPRTKAQAELFLNNLNGREAYMFVVTCNENEASLSVSRQAIRQKEHDGFLDVSKFGKYRTKYNTYLEETVPAIESLKSHIPYTECPVGIYGGVLSPIHQFFDNFVCRKNGESFQATESHFYPVCPEQYAAFWKKPSLFRYPVMVTITLANKCGDRCNGCFNAHMNDGKYIEPDVLKTLLADLKSHGTIAVKAAGREPTSYEYLPLFIDECEKNNLYSCIITAGAHLAKHKLHMMDKCTHLRVSMNTPNAETHKRIHNPMVDSEPYETRLNALFEIAHERKKRFLTTGTTFLIRNETADELETFVKMFEPNKVGYIRVASINYFAGIENTDELRVNKLAQISSVPVRFHKEFGSGSGHKPACKYPCPALLCRSIICADGSVVSCHNWKKLMDAGIPAVYGNIHENSFEEIWNGKNRLMTIKILTDMDHVCSACANCKYRNVNEINRWIAEHVNDGVFPEVSSKQD